MRIILLAVLLALIACFYSGARSGNKVARAALSAHQEYTVSSSTTALGRGGMIAAEPPAKVDFTTKIKPIFARRCQPCHFNGGVMYERLPFDRPETIKTLDTRLFSRIKDETEQDLIRKFLAQQ